MFVADIGLAFTIPRDGGTIGSKGCVWKVSIIMAESVYEKNPSELPGLAAEGLIVGWYGE